MDKDSSDEELECIATSLSAMAKQHPEINDNYLFMVSTFDTLTKEELKNLVSRL